MRQAQVQRAWAEYLLTNDGMSEDNQDLALSSVLADASSPEPLRQVSGHIRQSIYQDYYFDQKVDHFGLRGNSTFKQRFYINRASYVPGGPIYLFNSGETPALPSYLTGGQPYMLAKATGGMLIIMEHRYYGTSYPVNDMSGPNMLYLTIENSLEDIAHFVRNAPKFVKDTIGVTISPQSKWVATGGSYSANIAVWLREKYPELFHAAYASSAPILALADFYQYDQVVGRALPCAQNISDAIVTLDAILDSKNELLIYRWKQAFGLEALSDNSDFAGALTDQLSNTVQYYMPPAKGSSAPDSIATLCSWFKHPENIPLQNLADMTSAYIRNNGINPVFAYTSNSGAKNTMLYQDGRSWFYQTCTQFGYWQSAPRAPLRRLRSKYITAEWQNRPCREFFGDDVPNQPDTTSINKKFGGLFPNVTRVVFVNGLMDPWSELSVASDPGIAMRISEGNRNVVITMPKASHVTDFYFSSNRNDFGVDIARKRILAAIKDFLAQ
ncbi:hypothetical protein LPJ66_008143 [Kickxella alabastrina]|uniref:Uncharacterized protein n=1 Tax=Kickxella alabastrina TaxID=61397 RepID=A0ACC1IB76_9FUNG|nr:hypothetical protein LPJ66_008143 [Kickxella alabastrina]